MIPADFIRSLRERADILSIVERSVQLKKKGKDHWGRCPFHEDDSPSFTVAPAKGFYHCFGCGEHGDAIDFLQKNGGLSFADAVRKLAGELGLQVPNERRDTSANSHRSGIPRPPLKVERIERPADDGDTPVPLPDDLAAFLRDAQARLDDPRAIRYLQGRGISLDLAHAHGLGFAPTGFRGLPGGMTHDGPRIVAPHTQPDGTPVSLYGRRMDDCPKELRHRHLSERPRGIFNAQALVGTEGPLWLCEGVFDALSLAAVGITRPVAIFGLGRMRWSWVSSSQRELVLAVDTDAAGEKAVGGFLREAAMRGLVVSRLTADEMGGRKDINEALVAGVLRIGAPVAALMASTPHEVTTSRGHEVLPDEEPFADLQKVRSGDCTSGDGSIDLSAPRPSGKAPIGGITQTAAETSSPWWQRLAHVPDEPPEGVPGSKWQAFAPLCRRFALEHAERAAALGWTEVELASVPTMGTGTDAGALWDAACASAADLVVHADRIEIRSHSGSTLMVRRAYLRPSGVMPWAAPWAKGSTPGSTRPAGEGR